MGGIKTITFLASILFLTCPLNSTRLSKTVIPINYTLSLDVDPTDKEFQGSVQIFFDAKPLGSDTSVKEFQIHASPDYIDITNVAFNNTKNICNVSTIVGDVVTIKCSKDIQGDDQYIIIEYTGTYATEDMYGLYKSTYVEDGVTRTLLATQFEQTYARRAFPCFDEPEFKANFDIAIANPKNYTALSNTKGTTTVIGESAVTIFDTTPEMSTYLVAFVVSEFKSSGEAPKGANYTFSVYSRANAIQYTDIAVNWAPKLIELLGNFTGIPYSTLGDSKINLVAIPDFAAGAMENWGLITYREVDLLDEGSATTNNARQALITVIAHELAHQWFGDYVTLNWWSETWLNEGFATYLEYHIGHLADPSLELDKQFVTRVQHSALQVDAIPSADPLSSKDEDIDTAAQTDSKFGDISYDKGGSILRMIRFILGDTNFQKGLQAYLTKYKYENTKASNLLETLQGFVPEKKVNLSIYLNSWIYENGYPLLDVSLNKSVATIQCKKIFSTQATNATTAWYVPVTLTKSDKMDFETISVIWLEPKTTLAVNLSEDSFPIVNLQASGFYRVNYDTVLWSRIIAALKNDTQRNSIHVLNRAQLVDDIFNIATIDEIDYETAFSLAEYLANETEYYPWYSAFSAFDYLLNRVGDNETEAKLKECILQLLDNVIDVPLSQDQNKTQTHSDVLKQSLVLKWACQLGHSGCVKFAQQEHENYKKNSSSLVNYNLRDTIFCNGLRYSKNASEDFDFLFKIYVNSNSPNEKTSILNALACANDKDVLYQYLQKTVTDNSTIRKQDCAKVLQAVYTTNPIGLDVALDFLAIYSANISKYYKGMLATDTILRGIAKRITTDDQIKKLKKFIEDNNDSEAVKLIETDVVALAQANQKWIESHKDGLRSVLVGNSTTPSPSPDTTTPNHPSPTPTPSSAQNLTPYLGIMCWISFAFLSVIFSG